MTSVVSAEEATESPQFRQNQVNLSENALLNTMMKNNKTEIYNRIAQEDFDESIIFKHHKHKKPNDMTTSVNSLSSMSSDEHDSTITKATMMNLSTVTILPDLRSPDSILSDIKQKEKILADVLSFDKIKINPENLKQEEISTNSTSNEQNHVESKCNEVTESIYTNSPNLFKVPSLEKVHLDKFEDSYDVKQNGCLKQTIDVSLKLYKSLPLETPGKCFYLMSILITIFFSSDMKVIPHEWNLSSVQLVEERHKSESDNSLGDWEII